MTRCVNVDVEVYLCDFDDADLISELEDRGYTVDDDSKTEVLELCKTLYETMQSDPQKAWGMMANFIYEKTGRIVTKEI